MTETTEACLNVSNINFIELLPVLKALLFYNLYLF